MAGCKKRKNKTMNHVRHDYTEERRSHKGCCKRVYLPCLFEIVKALWEQDSSEYGNKRTAFPLLCCSFYMCIGASLDANMYAHFKAGLCLSQGRTKICFR